MTKSRLPSTAGTSLTRQPGKSSGRILRFTKRWRANFQPIRNAAASAVDVKAKLALGIFGSEIDFARRRIESFGYHNEMMN